MQHRTLTRILIFASATLLLTILLCTPSNAAVNTQQILGPDEQQVIRVFFPLQQGFTQRDEHGIYSGYTYEYLMKIAQLTGWKYKFEVVETTNQTLSEGLEAVKRGEFDLVGAMSYTPELAQDYLYSASPYGHTSYTLVTTEDKKDLNPRTVFDYPNLKVALIEKAKGQNQLFSQYCAESGLNFQPIYVSSQEQCKQLVESGQADALISKDVALLSGYQTVLCFNSQPFFFASALENTQLMQTLDWAMSAIQSSNSSLQDTLYEKYFSTSGSQMLSLTGDELAYLASAPEIRVVVPIGRAPVQDYDASTGQFSGIMIDAVTQIAQRCGLRFKLIPADNAQQALEMIHNGSADLIAGVPYSFASPESLYNSSVLLTSPVLSIPIVRVTSLTHNKQGGQILVYESSQLFQGQENVQYVDDIAQLVSLISKGNFSEGYADGYVAQYCVEHSNISNIMLTPTPYSNYHISLGVANGTDLRLMSILEQAISSLSQDEIEAMVYQNTNYTRQFGMLDTIKRNPLPFILAGFFVFTLVFVLLLSLFLKTRHINSLVSAERSRYQRLAQIDGLTQIYNHATFCRLASSFISQTAPHSSGTLIILDIDFFKEINDNYGHFEGDETLRKLAELLCTVFREEDLVSRFGGDEFSVLVKHTTDVELIDKRCQDIQSRCSLISETVPITVSIGAVIFSTPSNFDLLFQRADAALYKVKNRGRNGYQIDLLDDTPQP